MTLSKNKKMLIGVGVVAIAGYAYWKHKQSTAVAVTPAKAAFVGDKRGFAMGNTYPQKDATFGKK